MSGRAVTFSKIYDRPRSKLSKEIFSTLRKTDDYPNEGGIVDVKIEGRTLGEAKILLKSKRKLADIPTGFLLEDTGENSRARAISLLRLFYPAGEVTKGSEFTILFLTWVEKRGRAR